MTHSWKRENGAFDYQWGRQSRGRGVVDVHTIRLLRWSILFWLDPSPREGLGGRVPERECWCCMVWRGWCCPAERGSKASGSKYLSRTRTGS